MIFFNGLIVAINRLIMSMVRLADSTDELMQTNRGLIRSVQTMNVQVEELTKLIGLRTPGLVFLKAVREEDGMLVFVLSLPPKSATDVVSRELVVKIGDAESVTVNPPVDATESQEFSGPDNASVTGSLVDVDDAGNRSEARTFEFILTDTLAPGLPGELGVRIVREE